VSALGIVVLVLGILLLIALLFALVLIPVSRLAKRLQAELESELGSAIERIENARGLCLESRGASQTRGNGWLVLTPASCASASGSRTARHASRAPTSPPSWLGKSVGTQLLCALSSDPRA
jgi:hypothetical protein